MGHSLISFKEDRESFKSMCCWHTKPKCHWNAVLISKEIIMKPKAAMILLEQWGDATKQQDLFLMERPHVLHTLTGCLAACGTSEQYMYMYVTSVLAELQAIYIYTGSALQKTYFFICVLHKMSVTKPFSLKPRCIKKHFYMGKMGSKRFCFH